MNLLGAFSPFRRGACKLEAPYRTCGLPAEGIWEELLVWYLKPIFNTTCATCNQPFDIPFPLETNKPFFACCQSCGIKYKIELKKDYGHFENYKSQVKNTAELISKLSESQLIDILGLSFLVEIEQVD